MGMGSWTRPVVLAQFLDLETSPTEPPPSAAEEAERTGESPWTAGRAVIPEASIGHAFFALDEVWFAVFGASVASPKYHQPPQALQFDSSTGGRNSAADNFGAKASYKFD